jgi:hypothetical protein
MSTLNNRNRNGVIEFIRENVPTTAKEMNIICFIFAFFKEIIGRIKYNIMFEKKKIALL